MLKEESLLAESAMLMWRFDYVIAWAVLFTLKGRVQSEGVGD